MTTDRTIDAVALVTCPRCGGYRSRMASYGWFGPWGRESCCKCRGTGKVLPAELGLFSRALAWVKSNHVASFPEVLCKEDIPEVVTYRTLPKSAVEVLREDVDALKKELKLLRDALRKTGVLVVVALIFIVLLYCRVN
jgi:hypothetical protein